ncbi:gliding motility-associated-like protein [Flavobacterium arsenatis]|uniref:Gliding motility-associated-like protein n=1 Tax=Flavobacterium arsenatis TaxID=1484332 RepID=A0ABU1TLW0_9FLAO|nr:T9SS type B sorting domain-containing protein [Flavobacterium arsenatis]MDR6966959.1 gliding motility-associated-like protein [Flavobacterium arsenatis]
MNFQKIFSFLLLLMSGFCFSQGEANFWYFGDNCGLNFNSGSPTVIHDGELSTEEGCSSISTPFGELLFYTDGMNVYDKSHQIMPNGTGLYGNISSTQSSIILPKPGSSSIYYIFTVPNLGTGALRYSEVDMELNNGLGDVNEVKNVSLISPVCEKLTVVRNSEGNGFWVITHGFSGMFSDTGDSFFSFSVTSEGVNPNPVISQVGAVIDGLLYHTIGYLKVSPNGKKIISANYGLLTELFDFNRETGQITNPKIISTNHSCYGVEFSLSGNLVYLTTGEGAKLDELHQYDLTVQDIPSSKKIIHTESDGGEMYALQMAPDFKIYVAMSGTNYLSVINDPEVLGTGCNFARNSIDVSPGVVMNGLPQFNQSYFYGSILADNLCLGSSTAFKFLSDIEINTIHWDFGDGNSSNLLAPVHSYQNAGNYTVTVTATSNDGTVSKQKDITIYTPPVIADESLDVFLCSENIESIDLTQYDYFYLDQQTSSSYGVSYFDSYQKALNDGQKIATNYNLTFGESDIYVRVFHLENKECAVVSNFKIKLYQKPKPTVLNDIFICDDIANDGLGVFDLSSNNLIALNQDSNSFRVSYHLSESEAELGENDLENSFSNSSNPQQIFARIYNVLSEDCYAISSFNVGFYKMPFANQPSNFFGCYDENGAEFDLNLQIPSILGNQSLDEFEVSFYKNMEDAINGEEELPLLYSTQSVYETIYARVSNRLNEECFDITNFEIFSKAKPIIELKDVYAICEGRESVRINLPVGFSSYLWSNGDVSNQTEIYDLGNHFVTVSEDYGDVVCFTTINFIVRNSGLATIRNIEIQDWNGMQNSLFVHAEGIGEYHYSLDGINFQDNPYFDNLASGEYTVYVNDIYGCGTVEEKVFLLDYPRFFTPNNDGYNDFWKIKFSSEEEPNLEVLIFDRYGKLLKKFFGAEKGWDGTFEGNNLPSDDYWFVVNRQNGIFKGHFTLKR